MKKNKTHLTVIVQLEMDYEGHIKEKDIDWTDVFQSENITRVKKVKLNQK